MVLCQCNQLKNKGSGRWIALCHYVHGHALLINVLVARTEAPVNCKRHHVNAAFVDKYVLGFLLDTIGVNLAYREIVPSVQRPKKNPTKNTAQLLGTGSQLQTLPCCHRFKEAVISVRIAVFAFLKVADHHLQHNRAVDGLHCLRHIYYSVVPAVLAST